jgi:site-specific DNA-methyltransferase (adenine-specific)
MEIVELYNEDCLKIFKQIPNSSIDLIVTDCPYHIVSGGCTNDVVKIGRYHEMGKGWNHRYTGENDSAVEDTRKGKIFRHNEIKFSEWLPEAYRVLKQETHCYIMINPRNVKELQQEAEKVGFSFQNILIWDKGNATPNKWYMNAYEMILMLRKGKAKNINIMGSKNIIRVPNITRIKQHPTEKPVDLMKLLIENSSQKGEIVLDPFMGVGGGGTSL